MRKEKMFTMRMSQSDYDRIQYKAGQAGMSMTGFLTTSALNKRDYYYLTKGTEDRGRRNHCWNDVTVRKMLRNEVYIGHMVQNKRGTMSYKNKKQIDKRESRLFRAHYLPEAALGAGAGRYPPQSEAGFGR